MDKTCNRCGEPRALTDFDRDARNPDGHTGVCKACRRAATRARTADPVGREERLAKQRTISRRYAAKNRQAVLAAKKRYNKSAAGRQKQQEYSKTYRRTNRDKVNARLAVAYAVRAGKIPAARELPCRVCERPAVHYHHHRGYSAEHKLDVVPLCLTHHTD